MRKYLLMTTTALGVIASVALVQAQSGGGSQGGGGAGTMERGSGSMEGGQQGGQREGQRDRQQTQDRREGQKEGQRDRQQTQDRREGQKEGQRDRQQTQDRRDGDKGRGGRDQATGSAPSNVRVTSEQRTKIKQHTSSLRRVNNVNFNISVGTVVPGSVTLYDLPPAIVEIVPAYRGYKYVYVDDEIVIIEPSSLRIVAVIEV